MKHSTNFGFNLPEDYEYYSIDHNNENFGDENNGVDIILQNTHNFINTATTNKKYKTDFANTDKILTLGANWKTNKSIYNDDNSFKKLNELLVNNISFDHVSDSTKSIINAILEDKVSDLDLSDIDAYIDSLQEEYKGRFNGDDNNVSFQPMNETIKYILSNTSFDKDKNDITTKTYQTYLDSYKSDLNEWLNKPYVIEYMTPYTNIDNIINAIDKLLDMSNKNTRLNYFTDSNFNYIYRYINNSALESLLNYKPMFKEYKSILRVNDDLTLHGEAFVDTDSITYTKDKDGNWVESEADPVSFKSELEYSSKIANKVSSLENRFDEFIDSNINSVFNNSNKFSTKIMNIGMYIKNKLTITRNKTNNLFVYTLNIVVDKDIFNDVYKLDHNISDFTYTYNTPESSNEVAFAMNLYKQNDDVSNISDLITFMSLNAGKTSINDKSYTITNNNFNVFKENILFKSGDTIKIAFTNTNIDKLNGSVYIKHRSNDSKNLLIASKDMSVNYLDGIVSDVTIPDNIDEYTNSILFTDCYDETSYFEFDDIGLIIDIFDGDEYNKYTIGEFDTINLPVTSNCDFWNDYKSKLSNYYISTVNVLINDDTFFNISTSYKYDINDNTSIVNLISKELPLYETNFASYYKDTEIAKKYGLYKEGYDYSITSNNDEIIKNGKLLGLSNTMMTYKNSFDIYKSTMYKLLGIYSATMINYKNYNSNSYSKYIEIPIRDLNYNAYKQNADKGLNMYRYYGKLPDGTKGWCIFYEYISTRNLGTYKGRSVINWDMIQYVFTEYGKVYTRYGSSLAYTIYDKNKEKLMPYLSNSTDEYKNWGHYTMAERLARCYDLLDKERQYLKSRQIAWGFHNTFPDDDLYNELACNKYIPSDYDFEKSVPNNYFIEMDDCMTLSEIFDSMPYRRTKKYKYKDKYYTNQITVSEDNKFCDTESGWE